METTYEKVEGSNEVYEKVRKTPDEVLSSFDADIAVQKARLARVTEGYDGEIASINEEIARIEALRVAEVTKLEDAGVVVEKEVAPVEEVVG